MVQGLSRVMKDVVHAVLKVNKRSCSSSLVGRPDLRAASRESVACQLQANPNIQPQSTRAAMSIGNGNWICRCYHDRQTP